MKSLNHSSAYVLQIKRQWRVVVPVRGKLTPRICAAEFPSHESAEAWLRSDVGLRTIEAQRGWLSSSLDHFGDGSGGIGLARACDEASRGEGAGYLTQ